MGKTWLFAVLVGVTVATSALAEPAQLRVLGNYSGNKKQVDLVERPYFGKLASTVGAKTTVVYNTMDALNVKAPDAPRLLKSGAFDIASVQIGIASRDEPLFEGIDLAGVAIEMGTLRKVADAYRDVFDRKLQEKFNSKVMTLWPFGPQIIFCKKPLNKIEDFQGTKVRVFTKSMATLIEQFGGTPVTMPYGEVYTALHTGVVECGVTGPSAANNGKWVEVVTFVLPLAVSGAMQGHFMNLSTWKKFSPDQQKKLLALFKEMEDRLWDIAIRASDDAINCNVGKDPCTEHSKANLTLGTVTPEMKARIKEATRKAILPNWAKTCNASDPKCAEKWNATIGKVVDLRIN